MWNKERKSMKDVFPMWGGTGPRFSTAGPRYYLNTLFKVRIVSGIAFLPCLCFLHAISILTGYNLSLFNLSVQEQMVSQMHHQQQCICRMECHWSIITKTACGPGTVNDGVNIYFNNQTSYPQR